MYIKLANPASENRIHELLLNAIHVINNLRISNYVVSPQIRTYASVDAYNYKEETQQEPNRDDGRVIKERNISIEKSKLDPYTSTETDPFEAIKDKIYQYLIAEYPEYDGGEYVKN